MTMTRYVRRSATLSLAAAASLTTALTPAFARKALVMMEASQLLGFGPRLPEAVSQLHSQMLKATA